MIQNWTVSSDTNTLIIPNETGGQYLGIWRADADGGDPTEVTLQGAGTQRNIFGNAIARTLFGIDGQLIRTVAQQSADFVIWRNVEGDLNADSSRHISNRRATA